MKRIVGESLLALILVVASSLSSTSMAATAGHVDDFKDGTTQDWREGVSSPNPPTNVSSGGPEGLGDNYLENVSDGAGAGGKQIIFNTGSNWTGDFWTAEINLVRLAVRVDPSSEGPMELRIAFQGTDGARFISAESVSVPDDGAWHIAYLPFGEVFMSRIGTGVTTFSSAAAGVTAVRLMHRPLLTNTLSDWQGVDFNGGVGYDNISTLSVVPFSGWFWLSETFNTPSVPELEEGRCFGPLVLLVDSTDNWDLFGDDACVSRLTNNADPARTFFNYDQGTNTILNIGGFEARSTRPLVSAGGNLLEVYGEDVEGGVGLGEARLATLLAEPSGSDLLIAGAFDSFGDTNYTEAWGEVDVVVKDLPDVSATRVASDLEGRWYYSVFNRTVTRNNIDVNISTAGLRVMDLETGGACSFQVPDVVKDPAPSGNGDFLITAQFAIGGGFNLTDRGVSAGNRVRDRSACSYEIDADGYLSVDFTLTNNTVEPPAVDAINLKYVISADNNYIVAAPDPDGAQEDPTGLIVGYRAPSGMTVDAIDGDYLFYLNIGEQEATGLGHSGGWTGVQLIDLYGRGKVTFDSTAPAATPPGHVGDWYRCDINLVMDAADYQANGEPAAGSVSTAMEVFSERDILGCSYNLAADGSLLLDIDTAEPGEVVTFAGYVNNNGEVLSLIDIDTGIEFPETPVGTLVDYASVRHILGMKYTGNLASDEDGDGNSNLNEFQLPIPPEPFTDIVSLGDLNGNGSSDVAVAVAGGARVHIRDGSTDALITDIDFGADVAFDMAVLPDLDASGNPEIAILQQQASGQVRVQARDTVTGAVTKNLWFGLQYEPVSMDVVADYSGNSLPEVAVLGSEAGTDAVRVQIQDTATGFLDNVFLGTQSIAKDLVSVTDTSGNGIPEIGILGVLKANDQVRMQMWDAGTAAFQSNVWFAKVYQPQSTITMPDINSNGSDEIVAMGVDPATQNIRVQVRDSDTTATHYNIWLGAVNEAVDIALINDINGNGVQDLAVLLKTPTGTGRVRVQDGLNGAFIRNLFYTVVENPVGLAVMPDYSGNGFDELAVLGELIDPTTGEPGSHVQILDTSSGSQVNRIDFP
jgi:hypothetical protein